MRKPKWEDVTSYSQSAPRGTTEPRSWECRLDWLRVVVSRWIGCEGWFLTVYGIFDRLPLGSVDIEAAKQEALSNTKGRLQSALRRL